MALVGVGEVEGVVCCCVDCCACDCLPAGPCWLWFEDGGCWRKEAMKAERKYGRCVGILCRLLMDVRRRAARGR